jgi:uncharacterized phage protein (TIGR02218 family)
MSRTIPSGLLSHLQGQLLTVTTCVKIVRQDGVTLGLTTLDRDLTFASLVYEAMDPVSASAIQATQDGHISNLEVIGILSSSRITDTDLLAGLYDGAMIELFQVNYTDSPILDRVLLLTGTLGELHFSEGTYTAELRGLSQRLQQQVVELTSATCRVRQLFDSRCNPPGNTTPTNNPAAFRFSRTVSAVTSPLSITFGSDTNPSFYYRYGRVQFTSGLNNAVQKEVKEHTNVSGSAVLTLQEAFPFAVGVGDTATLEAGCDRTPSVCASRFSNLVNFIGEPFVPGNSQIMRRGRH